MLLNCDVGGEIVDWFNVLYVYIGWCLLEVNV